jgi:hypothetical protein
VKEPVVIDSHMKENSTKKRFVVCIKNDDCEDLELRKIYEVLPDKEAAEDDYIRVIDESGEDYLYPAIYFYPVELPQAVRETFRLAA